MGTSNSLVGAAAVVGLLVHLDGHGAARGDVALGLGRGGSSVASHVLGGHILNGRVAQRDTRTGGIEVRSVNLYARLARVPLVRILNNRTQSCWKVAWAATLLAARTVASAAEMVYFILTVFLLGNLRAE